MNSLVVGLFLGQHEGAGASQGALLISVSGAILVQRKYVTFGHLTLVNNNKGKWKGKKI